ncbi:MAG: DegV family protein [Cellulosilyticum sp.]|nr:DegV family protein [Cellulosilyticum sp.]
MQYGIVVDSSCDLTHLESSTSNKIDFTRVPLKLDVGTKEFVDDFDLDVEGFMKEVAAYNGKTGSAAPSPQAWFEAFEKSEYVFAITITSALSGSYSSAQTGARLFTEQYPNRKIHLIDSKSAGPELTLIAQKLVELIAQDLDFNTICERIEEYRKHTHLLFVLKSLDNLMKNGRVSKLSGTMAGLLGIKILGCASEEGTLELLQKCRGKMTAYNKAVETMLDREYKGGKVIISNCFAPDLAEYVASLIKEKYPDSNVEIMPASGLCSYYAEQGGLLIGFEV